MHRATKLQLTELNPLFACSICGGYLVDATAIIECLHSFCRTCIVHYLESNKFCPICEVQVHKTKPLLSIRSDKTLQDIVYKLVPGLYQNEMKRRRELYGNYPEHAIRCNSEERGVEANERCIYSPNENISLSLEYAIGNEDEEMPIEGKSKDEPSSEQDKANVSQRRYLQCPAALTIGHLKKFIIMKYGVPHMYQVVMRYSKEVLGNEYNLMDIAYIYSWKRSGPMRFFYTFVKQWKKFKTFHPSQDFSNNSVVAPEIKKAEELPKSQPVSRTTKPKKSARKSKLKGKSKPYKKVNSKISEKMQLPLLIKPHTVHSSSKNLQNNGHLDSASEICNIMSSNNSSSQEVCVKPLCATKDIAITESTTVCTASISGNSQNLTANSVVDSFSKSEQTCTSSLNVNTVSPVECSALATRPGVSHASSIEGSSLSTSVSCIPKPAASPSASSIQIVHSAPSVTTMSPSNIPMSSCCGTISSTIAPSFVPNHISSLVSNGVINSNLLPVMSATSAPSTCANMGTPITSTTANGKIISPISTENCFLSGSQNLVVSSISRPSINSSSTICNVLSTDSIVTAKNSIAHTIITTTTGTTLSSSVRSAASPAVRSSPSPSRKSNTSHLKPIHSSNYMSNPTLKFTLTSSCSPNHAGTATLSPAVIPNMDSPTNIMLISSTRSTSSTSSNVVSSVPSLIVCPTQNITMCSPSNIALIPSPGRGVRLASPPAVRGNRRGRPPTRHHRGILPRTNKTATNLLANGPAPKHIVSSTPRLANGSHSRHSVATPFSAINPAPSFVVCSIPGMPVQSAEPRKMTTSSIIPVSSAAMTVSSSLPYTQVATSSTAAIPPVFQSSPKPSTKTDNASPLNSQVVDLPIGETVPNGVSVPSPQIVLESKDKLEPSTEFQAANDKELPHSDNLSDMCLSSVNASNLKTVPSNSDKQEPLSSKEVSVSSSTSPGKKEGITLKISVKNSTYHADFSDNDDLGCQPDLVVDEQKMDSSDEGETDYVLKEKIKAIAEKEDEADATDDADSGRASDVSNQARSSCDDDVGSPTSIVRTADVELPVPNPSTPVSGSSVTVSNSPSLPTPATVKEIRPHSKVNGLDHIVDNLHRSHEPKKDNIGALDLSFCCGKKSEQDKSPWPRPRTVANPPVLDMKHRLPTCLTAPTKPHTACPPAPAPKINSHSLPQRVSTSSPSPSSHSTIPISRHSPAAPTQTNSRHIMASPISPSYHRMVTGTPSAHQANVSTSPHNIASMLHRQTSSSPHNRLIPPAANHSPSSVSALRSMLSPSTPSPPTYEMIHPPSSMYKKNESSHRNSHNRHKNSNLAVFNPDPNGIRQKIVIKNLDPRPSHHSHHHRRL